MSKIRFTIVDDHRLFADGLARILQETQSFELIKLYNSGSEFLDELDHLDIDLFIIDIQLGELSGLDLCTKIKASQTESKVILISMIEAPHLIKLGQKNGADGFIPKTTDAHDLKEMVYKICQGEKIFVNKAVSSEGTDKINLLTEREMEIIHMVKSGKSTRTISEELFLSEFTVETHRKNILKKLQLSSANELIAYAYANHL